MSQSYTVHYDRLMYKFQAAAIYNSTRKQCCWRKKLGNAAVMTDTECASSCLFHLILSARKHGCQLPLKDVIFTHQAWIYKAIVSIIWNRQYKKS